MKTKVYDSAGRLPDSPPSHAHFSNNKTTITTAKTTTTICSSNLQKFLLFWLFLLLLLFFLFFKINSWGSDTPWAKARRIWWNLDLLDGCFKHLEIHVAMIWDMQCNARLLHLTISEIAGFRHPPVLGHIEPVTSAGHESCRTWPEDASPAPELRSH